MPFLSLRGIDNRRDLLQPAADLILGALDVVLRLQAHPERRRGAERLGEPQSRVSGERGLPIDQPPMRVRGTPTTRATA